MNKKFPTVHIKENNSYCFGSFKEMRRLKFEEDLNNFWTQMKEETKDIPLAYKQDYINKKYPEELEWFNVQYNYFYGKKRRVL